MSYTSAQFRAGAPRFIMAALGPFFLEALDVMNSYAPSGRPLSCSTTPTADASARRRGGMRACGGPFREALAACVSNAGY